MTDEWRLHVNQQMRDLVMGYPISVLLHSLADVIAERADEFGSRSIIVAIDGERVDLGTASMKAHRWRWVAREVELLAKNPKTRMAR